MLLKMTDFLRYFDSNFVKLIALRETAGMNLMSSRKMDYFDRMKTIDILIIIQRDFSLHI